MVRPTGITEDDKFILFDLDRETLESSMTFTALGPVLDTLEFKYIESRPSIKLVKSEV